MDKVYVLRQMNCFPGRICTISVSSALAKAVRSYLSSRSNKISTLLGTMEHPFVVINQEGKQHIASSSALLEIRIWQKTCSRLLS